MAECPSYKIYAVFSEQNLGERSQIKGLIDALQKKLQQKDVNSNAKIEVEEFLFQDTMALKKKLESEQNNRNQRKVVVASGETGLVAIEELKNTPNTIFIHTAHQPFSRHIKTLDVAHFVILPKYTIPSDLRTKFKNAKFSKLIETTGVIHNSSEQEVLKAYHNNINLVVSAPFYIIVMLGGDVVSGDGKILYFSESRAEKLALYVKNIAHKKNGHIIIVNGPRTGMYDPSTNKADENAHRNGVIDSTTRKFITTLKAPPYKVSYSLFDFQYDGKRGYANLAYGILLNKKQGLLFIPGDSDSFISEGSDLLPGEAIVYYTESMTPLSKTHIDLEFELKRINTLDLDMKLNKVRFSRHQKNNSSIAKQVADAIVDSGAI
jgi:hypothetical protein